MRAGAKIVGSLVTDGAGATEEWQHDHRGNRTALVSRITTPSASVTWAYDRGDRMTSRTADSATTTYTYDDNGNMLTAAGATGTITATYDRLDRIRTVDPDDAAPDTAYTYGQNSGQRDDPSGTGYFFSLDKWGRQTAMDTTYADDLTQTIRADGLPLRFTDSTGAITDRTYDAAGRLTGIGTSDAACTAGADTDCAVITYTYNRAGMRRTETSTIDGDPGNGTADLAYDSAGRLTGYGSPLGDTSDRDYAWDEVVSRTAVTSDPSGTPSTVTTSFSAADRPTTDTGGGSYAHDAGGRMTARPGQTLEWDSLGRLTRVRDSSTTAVISGYTYDALDRLREVTSGGSTTRMRYVGLSTTIASLYDTGTATTTRSYATDWDGSTHASFTTTSGSQRSYGTNGHGDVTWTAGDTGAVTRTYRYDPWGTIASSGSGHSPHLRFQSSWRDSAVELYWVVTRWYAPAQGRFISEDSLLGQPINPDSRHRYAYAEGDPVDGWDPDGRQTDQFQRGLDFIAQTAREAGWVADKFGVVAGMAFLDISNDAANTAKDYFPLRSQSSDGGIRDACRHCIWSGMLTRRFGADVALRITNHHEDFLTWNGEAIKMRKMDVRNNTYGRFIGSVLRQQPNNRPIKVACRWAAAHGRLVIEYHNRNGNG